MTYLIALINFIAAFLQAATGFGYAIVAMFLMPRFLPYQQCSIISAATIIIIAAQMCWTLRAHIRLRKILWPMACCLSTLWIGVWLISVLDVAVVRKVMGAFLILLAVYFYILKKHRFSIKSSWFNGLAIGMLTGLATGMFNIVGPFLTIYYYDNMDDTLEIKANLEFSFLIAGIVSLALNLVNMPLDAFLVQNIALSGVAVIVAGFLGIPIYRRFDKERFKYVIITVLPIMGLVQILK